MIIKFIIAGSKLNNYSNRVLQTSSGKYLVLLSALQNQPSGSTTAIICGLKRHKDVSSLEHHRAPSLHRLARGRWRRRDCTHSTSCC